MSGFVGMYTHCSDGSYHTANVRPVDPKRNNLIDELIDGSTCQDVSRREVGDTVDAVLAALEGLQGGTENMEVDGKVFRDWGVGPDSKYDRITPGGVAYKIQVPRAPAMEKAPKDLAKVVSSLRLLLPLLQYAKADRYLRHLVMSTLMK